MHIGLDHLDLFCCCLLHLQGEMERKEKRSQLFPDSEQNADTGPPCDRAAASRERLLPSGQEQELLLSLFSTVLCCTLYCTVVFLTVFLFSLCKFELFAMYMETFRFAVSVWRRAIVPLSEGNVLYCSFNFKVELSIEFVALESNQE